MWTIKVYSPTILFHMHVSHPFLYISVCYYLRIHIREIRRRRDDRSKKQYRVDRQEKKVFFYVFIDFPSKKVSGMSKGWEREKFSSLHLTPSSYIHTHRAS